MIEFISTWIKGIIIAVVIATIIEMILPNGNSKKYIKMVLGVYIIFNIIAPIINQFSKGSITVDSIINVDEYMEKLGETKTLTKNSNYDNTINNSNETVKQIYINNLKKDITNKLKDKEYEIDNINIEVENDEQYTIKQINMSIYKNDKKDNKDNKSNINSIQINEIESVNIKVDTNNFKSEVHKDSNISQISESEKSEIKKYIVDTYNVNKNNIFIQ